jgi:hypothetical protein
MAVMEVERIARILVTFVDIGRGRSQFLDSVHGHKDECSCAECQRNPNMTGRDALARVRSKNNGQEQIG